MRRIFSLISLIIAIGFLGIWGLVTLSAQQKPATAGAKDSDIPVFKTSSNLVLVTVYVRGKDGKLRGLAVLSLKRAAVLPEVPTMAEAGVPDQESDTLTGVVAPAANPKSVGKP